MTDHDLDAEPQWDYCPSCGCCVIDQDAGHENDPNCPCWNGDDDD